MYFYLFYSDGGGRTGAFITLDIVLDNIRDRGTVDILSTINSIRRFRPSLVDHVVRQLMTKFFLNICEKRLP